VRIIRLSSAAARANPLARFTHELLLRHRLDIVVVVDEELDEVVELLGLFEGYDDSHAAPPEILRITRAAVEMIRAAQHVLAMMRDEVNR
jgi:hypothetical protein